MSTTIVFEDNGQDFIEWDVFNGVVIASRPFQGSVWCGFSVINRPRKGGFVKIAKPGLTMRVKHRIERVKRRHAIGKPKRKEDAR